ncbi:MAG TPA: hypothetical protein VFO49_05585 [Nocardioides sp.]|nr:hypothetical protein [Nocardioides sp.]
MPRVAPVRPVLALVALLLGLLAPGGLLAPAASAADPITTVTAPWVEGDAKSGRTLTAHLGTYAPADATLNVQWLADGTPIAGQTGPTYVVPTFPGGKRFSIRVTAARTGFTSTTVTSLQTGPAVSLLGTAKLENRALPTVSGEAAVGATLSTTNGQWSQAPTAFGYQWLADGQAVAGATAKTFVLTAAQQGKKITAKVTATSGSRTAAGTSDPTAAVAAGTVTNVTLPTITGTPAVGAKLTATPGTWSVADPTITYEWLADDVVIAGATAATFTPTATQADKQISVRVTAAKQGFTAGTATSAKTAPVDPAAVVNTKAPTVAGDAKVGSVLTADEGTWTPAPTSFAYQWLSEGAVIAGATAKTYTPVASLEGKRLAVRVTAKFAGLQDGVATSAPTAPLTAPAITVTGGPRVSGSPALGRTLIARPGAVAPSDVTVAYRWLRGDNPIAGANGSTYRVTTADLGKRISVRVEYKLTGADPVLRTSPRTAPATTRPTLFISKEPLSRSARITVSVRATGVSVVRGVVAITEGSRQLKRLKLRGGEASGIVEGLTPGRHRLRAVYSGDPRVAKRNAPIIVTVTD